MTKQPEALQAADALSLWGLHEKAAVVRRLHTSEKEGWRYADELEQDRKRLHEVNVELLAAFVEHFEKRPS